MDEISSRRAKRCEGSVSRSLKLAALGSARAASAPADALRAGGPETLGRDAQGRDVYFRLQALFTNKDGQLELRDDGLTFTGEVVVEIAWHNVAHLAETTHTYRGDDYAAIALQEGKRRTSTKFAFVDKHDRGVLPRGGEAVMGAEQGEVVRRSRHSVSTLGALVVPSWRDS
jgi:hypothetical protein